MTRSLLKIAVKIGLVTGGLIILYELSDQLLIYHYFKYEYYIVAIAIIALITGILLTRKYHNNKTVIEPHHNPLDDLTTKELKILSLISEGCSNKEIAALNFVEMSTVKTHINNIYAKLGVTNRKNAVKVYGQSLDVIKSTLSPPPVI